MTTPHPQHSPEQPIDANVQRLIDSFRDRADHGFRKYGVTTAGRGDLTHRQWCQHHLEELMDACVYMTQIIRELDAEAAKAIPRGTP